MAVCEGREGERKEGREGRGKEGRKGGREGGREEKWGGRYYREPREMFISGFCNFSYSE